MFNAVIEADIEANIGDLRSLLGQLSNFWEQWGKWKHQEHTAVSSIVYYSTQKCDEKYRFMLSFNAGLFRQTIKHLQTYLLAIKR